MDHNTGLIEEDIPTVLNSLFAIYGKVQSEEVKIKEVEVLNLTFNPDDSMVTMYRHIKELQKLATAASISYSDAQQLEFSLTLIRNTRDFEKALSKWKNSPAIDKTWANFKLYFKDAQADLKEIRGLMMQQAGYHHVNMLAMQLEENMVSRNTSMFSTVQKFAAAATEVEQYDNPPHPQNQTENAVSQDTMQLKMLRILREI